MQAILEMKINQVFLTQEAFRTIMDCMARPGKIGRLNNPGFSPPWGLTPYSALLLLTLLDSETSFAVLPCQEEWSGYIKLNTDALENEVSQAEYILLDGSHDIPDLLAVNRGELLSPEKGVTLIYQVDTIGAAPLASYTGITLKGPGIKETRSVYINGMDAPHWERIKHLNREYPLGVDLFIIARDGSMIGIPRSNHFAWEVLDSWAM